MDSSKYSSLKKLYIYLRGMGSTTEGGGWPCPWGTGSLMLWPGPGIGGINIPGGGGGGSPGGGGGKGIMLGRATSSTTKGSFP